MRAMSRLMGTPSSLREIEMAAKARLGCHTLLLPGALALAVLLLAAGAAAVNELAARWLLRADAEATAHAWAANLSDQLGPELPALLAGRPPSPVAKDILDQARRIGAVSRYKLLDADGAPVFVSGEDHDPTGQGATVGARSVGNGAAMAGRGVGGLAYIRAERGSAADRPAFDAQARVPLWAGGKLAGIAEADVDQSDKQALFRRVFFATEAATMTLVLAAGSLVGLIARRRLRDRDAAASAARAMAVQDPLTGLLNRRGLVEALDATLAPDAAPAVLCLVDLDGFKGVNDTHGHAAGDALLRAAAGRLRAAARGRDLVARLGGDEFVVLASIGGAGAGCPRQVAADLAQRLVMAMTEAFLLEGVAVPVRVAASVGVALVPEDADVPGPLLRRADLALYRAKAEGRGCFRFYEQGMDAPARERALREAELRAAIAGGGLEPHYQPLVDLASGQLLGFEALARWHHPARGPVAPAEFVPLAEQAGLIWPLTEALLGRACAAAATWPDHLLLSFNVSPVQLRERGRLAALVATALSASGLPARRLQLELTEGALTADVAAGREVLAELKASGVRLALDDFGTGHSGLRELQALSFDALKLDRSFVRAAAEEDMAARRIVAAVVGLGQSLGLPVVAEGVEEENDAEMLRVLGCDAAQGWLFGRPMPEAGAAALAAAMPPVRKRRRASRSGGPEGIVAEEAPLDRRAVG